MIEEGGGEGEGGQTDPPQKKLLLKSPALLALNIWEM